MFTCSTAIILSYKRLSNTDLLLMLWAAELLRKYLTTVFMANCAQICKLSVLGRRSLSDVVGGMVKFLLTVPMQRRYNWCGLKGKMKFGDLGIAGVLCSKCDNILLMIAIVQVMLLYVNIIDITDNHAQTDLRFVTLPTCYSSE